MAGLVLVRLNSSRLTGAYSARCRKRRLLPLQSRHSSSDPSTEAASIRLQGSANPYTRADCHGLEGGF